MHTRVTDGGPEQPEGVADSDPDRQLLALLDRYELRLYRFLAVLLGDHDLAQECAQDTFVRAYEHLQRGRHVTAGWLYKVARNRAMDEFRRGRRERADPRAIKGVMADGMAEGAELRQALSTLSPEDRALLYLVAVESLPAAEIASSLGITIGAVYMRISRARSRLRALLGGDDEPA